MKKIPIAEESWYFREIVPIQFQNADFLEAWKCFVTNRCELGKNFTHQAAKNVLAKLKIVSKGNLDTAIRILNNSIENGWMSVFPEKESFDKYGYIPRNNLSNTKTITEKDLDKISKPGDYLKHNYSTWDKTPEEIKIIKKIWIEEQELWDLHLEDKCEEKRRYENIHAKYKSKRESYG